jgi:hypothetical protein
MRADELGWQGLENGALLDAAEQAGFDLLLTCDQNVPYQQNFTGRKLSLVILSSNHWPTLRPIAPKIATAIDFVLAGRIVRTVMKLRHVNPRRLIPEASLAIGFVLTFETIGCVYRLPPATLPSQHRLKVVSNSPEVYSLRLRTREPHDYRVPTDGRVTLDLPGSRDGCSVYLFDRIRIRSGASPFTAITIDVIGNGRIARQLSLKQMAALPVDAEGYHLLTVPAAK